MGASSSQPPPWAAGTHSHWAPQERAQTSSFLPAEGEGTGGLSSNSCGSWRSPPPAGLADQQALLSTENPQLESRGWQLAVGLVAGDGVCLGVWAGTSTASGPVAGTYERVGAWRPMHARRPAAGVCCTCVEGDMHGAANSATVSAVLAGAFPTQLSFSSEQRGEVSQEITWNQLLSLCLGFPTCTRKCSCPRLHSVL